MAPISQYFNASRVDRANSHIHVQSIQYFVGKNIFNIHPTLINRLMMLKLILDLLKIDSTDKYLENDVK